MDPNHPPVIPSRRTLKPGATCRILGEGSDRFTIRAVDATCVLIDELGSEERGKVFSVRYPPRLPSYRRDKLATS